MAATILDVFDALDVLHVLHLGVLLAEEVGRLAASNVPQRNVPPSDDGRGNTGGKYVFVAASAAALESVGHAAWLLSGAETGAAHISDSAILPRFVGIEWALLVLAVLAGRVGSLDEFVAVGAALPLTAAMLGSSVLFLSGENSGAATALLAATALAVMAAVLGRVADAKELPLMYVALGSASAMVFGAVLLFDRDPPADNGNGDSVNTLVLVFAMCVAAGASVVAQAAAPEKHMISQFALAIVAAMVGCSLLLLSGGNIEQDAQGWGWSAIVAVGMLLVSITEKHETIPVLSCMVFFLATVSWSIRVLAVQGEVAAFVDSPMWVAMCWGLPGAAILRQTSGMQNGVLLSGAMTTIAMMVWLALNFLAPDDIPAVGFVTKPSRLVGARLEMRGAAMTVKTPLAAESAPGVEAANIDANVLPGIRTEAKTLSNSEGEEAKALSNSDGENFLSEAGNMDEKSGIASSLSESTPSPLESTLPEQKIVLEEAVGHKVKFSDVVHESKEDAEEMQPSNQSPEGAPVARSKTPEDVKEMQPSCQSPKEAPVAKSKTPEVASAYAAVLQTHTHESNQSHEREDLQATTEQSEDQNVDHTVNYLLSPGMWAILTSLPIIGQSVDTKAGVPGAVPFAVATGAAAFLATYMFECAFAYLAPDDAGPSMCFKPTLLWYAAAAMMVCIAAVPVSYSPRIKNGAGSSLSKIAACVCIGVFLTACMAGCALHHVAPEDIGRLVCGPLGVFTSPEVTTSVHGEKASARIEVPSVAHASKPRQTTANMGMAAGEAWEGVTKVEEQQRATEAAQQAEAARRKEEDAAQKIEEQGSAAEAAQEMQAATGETEAEAVKAAEVAEAAAAQAAHENQAATVTAEAEAAEAAAAPAAAKIEEQRAAAEAAQEIERTIEKTEVEAAKAAGAAEAAEGAEAAKAIEAAEVAKEHGVDSAAATADRTSRGQLSAEAAEVRVETNITKTQMEVKRVADEEIKMIEEVQIKIHEIPTETNEERPEEIDDKFVIARKQVEAEIEAKLPRSKQSAVVETANASAESQQAAPIRSDQEPWIHWTILLPMDIIIIVGISILVARSFSSYCSNVGLPFTWVMSGSGDDYDGDVTNIPKPVSIFFTSLTELHPVPHGYGLYTFACGTEYDGGWKEGKMCGVHGKLSFVEGHVYDGEWADGQPNGHGTFTWAGGSVFMGEFSNGVPHGQGIKTWPDGHSYSGQWKAGMKHGFGKYSWANGSSYSGGWSEDKMHGHGTYCFENKDSYTGAWENDVKCGVGTYRWSDGHSELRVFSDEAAVCPESTVEPGACPKTGRKFVECMSNFRCASAYRSPSKSDGSRPYSSPRRERPFTPTSPRARRSGSFKLETGTVSTPNGSTFTGVEELT